MGLFDRAGGRDGRKGHLRRSGGDVMQVVIDYVKQETFQPLKGLGRFVAFGVAGSLALCTGLVLLLVGLLRLLQSETGDTFGGHLSWLPYVIVAAVGAVVLALSAWRIGKGAAARRVDRREERGS